MQLSIRFTCNGIKLKSNEGRLAEVMEFIIKTEENYESNLLEISNDENIIIKNEPIFDENNDDTYITIKSEEFPGEDVNPDGLYCNSFVEKFVITEFENKTVGYTDDSIKIEPIAESAYNNDNLLAKPSEYSLSKQKKTQPILLNGQLRKNRQYSKTFSNASSNKRLRYILPNLQNFVNNSNFVESPRTSKYSESQKQVRLLPQKRICNNPAENACSFQLHNAIPKNKSIENTKCPGPPLPLNNMVIKNEIGELCTAAAPHESFSPNKMQTSAEASKPTPPDSDTLAVTVKSKDGVITTHNIQRKGKSLKEIREQLKVLLSAALKSDTTNSNLEKNHVSSQKHTIIGHKSMEPVPIKIISASTSCHLENDSNMKASSSIKTQIYPSNSNSNKQNQTADTVKNEESSSWNEQLPKEVVHKQDNIPQSLDNQNLIDFFTSMFEETKRLTPKEQRSVKLSLLQTICKIEDELEDS